MKEWISEYIGIPFLDHGRDPAKGLDCCGLVVPVLEAPSSKQLPLPTGAYSSALDHGSVSYLIDTAIPLIGAEKVNTPQDGDIALIKFSGQPVHTGVFVGEGCVLHARRALGVVCEKLDGPHLRGKVEGIYRVL